MLDTNILLFDPQSIFRFEDNNLYIPIYVIEEIDKFKSESTERGKNARETLRYIDELGFSGSLSDGVKLPDGGKLVVYIPGDKTKVGTGQHDYDTAILNCAIKIRDVDPETKTILVTMDANLRIRADAVGLQKAPYESQSVDPNQLHSGITEVRADYGEIDKLFARGWTEAPEELVANESIMLVEDGTNRTALGRYVERAGAIRKLNVPKEGILGIKPRNREQQFAMDLVLDPDIPLVVLNGMAGTGKSLLASTIGLYETLEGQYTKLSITRPMVSLGSELGYLPGGISEKFGIWVKPLMDNLEYASMSGNTKKRYGVTLNDLINTEQIQLEPLSYIRGRTMPNQFIICDEFQNASPKEVKAMITRVGENSKIVLTGDPYQTDHSWLNKASNGITLTVERLRGSPLVGHITMTKGERSPLATLAADRL